jgi:hypothetical protein
VFLSRNTSKVEFVELAPQFFLCFLANLRTAAIFSGEQQQKIWKAEN